MVPTEEARITRQIPYSAVLPMGIASARLAMCPPLELRSRRALRKVQASRELEAGGSPGESVESSEREDGAALGPWVAPGARRNAIRQRQCTSRSRHRIGLAERLFESVSHPVVKFVVQGTDRHRTFMPCTSCHGLNLLRMRTLG